MDEVFVSRAHVRSADFRLPSSFCSSSIFRRTVVNLRSNNSLTCVHEGTLSSSTMRSSRISLSEKPSSWDLRMNLRS